MTAGLAISSGAFYFHPSPWWEALDRLPLPPSVTGLQMLYEVDGGPAPLPPDELLGALCRRFDVVLHPCFADSGPLWDMAGIDDVVADVNRLVRGYGIDDVILHASHFAADPAGLAEARARLAGPRLHIENMGSMGGGPGSLEAVAALLEAVPGVGLVLDVAHLEETGLDAGTWLAHGTVARRLAMVHASASGLARPADALGNLPEDLRGCHHLPAFLAPDAHPESDREALARLPLVMEGCLPADPALCRDYLAREADHLASWAGAEQRRMAS